MTLDRIPVVRDLVRFFRSDRLGLLVEVHAARGIGRRPGVNVTVTNPSPVDLYLESVGMIFADGSAFGDWVGVELPVGSEPHVSWYGLAELEARIGRRDPIGGLQHVFAATSVGTSRLSVDRRRLRAEATAMDSDASALDGSAPPV